ncbi:MAG: hypothetical protein EOP11_06290 [Proteobacteria bacterium]|nr:MAG: hypothetical protein EOP11_06290 [Pseudomonadota bacterium]
MIDKKIASRSLSALVFALGAGSLAHASNADGVNIQSLELSEESAVSEAEFERTVSDLQGLAANTNWGGSGSLIRSGNYASLIRAGNYASLIRAGNYANLIRAGNYANLVRAGNYARVEDANLEALIPSPQLNEANLDGDSQ